VGQSDRDTVRALPLFCSMSRNNFDQLMAAAETRQFSQHATVLAEGNFPEFLYIVMDGAVELSCTHDAHKTTIDIVRPVTPLILGAVIRNDVYLSSVRTLTPAQLLLIPAQSVRDAFNCDSSFARAVAYQLTEQYGSLVRSLKNEKLRTGMKRLANWILRTDAMQGNQRIIELTVEKRTLASSLGMTPENLSRNLARLTRYGVRTSGRDIVIEDSFALERFAKPNALIDG